MGPCERFSRGLRQIRPNPVHGLQRAGNRTAATVVRCPMNKDDVERYARFDWKALGYITSIVSVFFLGAIAWPKPDDPGWHLPVLIIGMATSIVGMGFRYLAHIQQKKKMSENAGRR